MSARLASAGAFRVVHRAADGSERELLTATGRVAAFGSAAGWVTILRRRGKDGAVVVRDAAGAAVRSFPLGDAL